MSQPRTFSHAGQTFTEFPADFPASSCPTCGYVMDSATCTSNVGRLPVPGDVSLCLCCGEILQFSADLKLVVPSLSVLMELDPQTNNLLLKLQRQIRQQRPVCQSKIENRKSKISP